MMVLYHFIWPFRNFKLSFNIFIKTILIEEKVVIYHSITNEDLFIIAFSV